MKEKLTIIIVLLFTIIILVIAWFWLQNVIEEYDLDSPGEESAIDKNETYLITSGQ